VSARTEAELARKEDLVGQSLAGSSTGGTNAGVELPRPQAVLMSSGDSWPRPRGGGGDRAVCSSPIPGEDPGGDGPGVVLMSPFRVEILRLRRRPRLGQTPPKV
jgi:hypothetical protein